MNGPNEVLTKFGELEDAMKTHFGKVDPRLIVDMIFRHRDGKKDPRLNPCDQTLIHFVSHHIAC